MDEDFTDPSTWALLESTGTQSTIRIPIEGPQDLLKLKRAVPHFAQISSGALNRLMDAVFETTAGKPYIDQIASTARGLGLHCEISETEIVSLVPIRLPDRTVRLIPDADEARDLCRKMQEAGCRIIKPADLEL